MSQVQGRETKILNSKGQPIFLNEQEARIADFNQRHANALGFEIDMTSLSGIEKLVTEQKFFEIAPADYMPLRVGSQPWSSNIITYRSYDLSGDFESGIVNTGSNSDRLAVGDAGVDSVTVPVVNWAKASVWNLIEVQQAARAGNWDLIANKLESRKKNWDLGIQKIAFLGSVSNSSVLGLYTQTDATVDTSTLPQPISTLSTVDLKAFCQNILNVYRAANGRTAWPTHFVVPESDYLGLAGPASSDFPIKSVLEQLLETLRFMTKNPNFKVMPCAYGDVAYSGQTYQQYALYNADPKSLRMDLPVDFTATLANSVNGFQFQNVAYGQFTGVKAYRPLEMYYFRFTP